MIKKLWINEHEYIAFSERKNSLAEEIATRKRSSDFYSLGLNLPDPDPVLRKQNKDIRIYKELLCDPHVWACVQSRKSGVLSLEWEIDRGKAKSRQAKVIESIFNNLDLYTLISEILNASLFGFQPLEVMWMKDGSLTVPKEIKAKPPEWFLFDDDNNLKFKTKENINGELLPTKKFLCPQYNPSYQNPYGERTLSRVFWPVTFKKGGLKFWVIFTEKYGMPFLVGKHPRGTSKEDTDNLADMLQAMVQDAIAVIPDDSSVEIQEAGGKGASAEIYDKLIDKMNSEISKAILGQTLTTEIGDKGSYAASNTHLTVRQDIIDSDKKMVEKTLNLLIRWVYELNFAEAGNTPLFTMWEEEYVDLNLAHRDKILKETGVQFTRDYFMKTYGFEEEDITVDPIDTNQEDIQNDSISSTKENSAKISKNASLIDNFLTFAQETKENSEQEVIDTLLESFTDKEYHEQTKPILQPVINLISSSSSFTEIITKLKELNLEKATFEETLAKTLFVSEIWGRLNG